MVIPGWLKPPSWTERLDGVSSHDRTDLGRTKETPIFLHEVRQWEVHWQRMLFQILVPVQFLARYHIDPIRLTDAQGRPIAFAHYGSDRSSFRLELFADADDRDPLGEVELADTMHNQIEIVWVALQDPSAPRFDVDLLPDGESTMRGVTGRNLAAEEAALAAGLAPGQTHKGLGSFRWLAERVETLMLCLNQREYVAQPLFYHTALLFERCGFQYIQGRRRMEALAEGFAPGGELRARLDGSTPFRQPAQADSIIGRSWAIHDGVYDQPWDRVRMVKRLGIHAGVDTSPGVAWAMGSA